MEIPENADLGSETKGRPDHSNHRSLTTPSPPTYTHSPTMTPIASISSTKIGSRSSYLLIHARRKARESSFHSPCFHQESKRRRPARPFSFGGSLVKIFVALVFVASLDGAMARWRKCLLPKSWNGEWFISGIPKPVLINATSLSHKGECIHNLKDRYLFQDPYYKCYRCMVIHQKHENVLQYKETYCHKSNILHEVCAVLAADVPLYSLFRINAEPITCPFQHTYVFSYNRGRGVCSYPPSTLFSCIEDWRLLFKYQACPDIHGTESKSEELVCLANWNEGSNRYLVGKSDHPLATSDEDRYRCFVYDDWESADKSGFKIALSGDATCDGLFSVNDGSRTLNLTKVESSTAQCLFPSWINGPHWHSLDGGTTLHVTRRSSTIKLTDRSSVGESATHSCFKEMKSNKTSAIFTTRLTQGCNSGYKCIQLISRDSHVLEIKMGNLSVLTDPEAACSRHYFDESSQDFATFVSGWAESKNCPSIGHYEVLRGSLNSMDSIFPIHGRDGSSMTLGSCEEEAFTALSVGCSSKDTLEIHTTCSISEFSCHGWWMESGWQFLVVTPVSRSSKGARRLCLVMNKGEEVLSVASSSHSCNRELRELLPGHHGLISLNSTSRGRCEAITTGMSGASGLLLKTTIATSILESYACLSFVLPLLTSLGYLLR